MKKILLTALISTLIFSCSNKTSRNDLIGKWIDEEKESSLIELEKFGKNIGFKANSKNYPLIVKEEIYYVNFSGKEIPLLYDEKTDLILFEGKKYKRIKNSLKEKSLGRWNLSSEFEDATPSEYANSKSIWIHKENSNYYLNDYFKKNNIKINFSKETGLTVKESYRDYPEDMLHKKINGKDYIIFEGMVEGDNWKYYYEKVK